MYAIVWAAVLAVALFGRSLIRYVAERAPVWGPALLGTSWLGTTLAGVLAGKSPRTSTGRRNTLLEWLALVAPYVFIVGLVAFVSLVVNSLLTTLTREFHFRIGWAIL